MRRLEDLRRAASAAARGLQGGEQAVTAAFAAYEADRGDAALERLGHELRVLMSVSSAVAAAHSLSELVDLGAEQALTALDAASVSISQLGRARPRSCARSSTPGTWRPGRRATPRTRSTGSRVTTRSRGCCSKAGPTSASSTTRSCTRSSARCSSGSAVRSCAAVPIMLGDVAWGELWATRGGRHAGFDKHDLRLLNAIAGQLAAGVARAELYGRLAELAFEDELTGLANRSALHERLELAFELVRRAAAR